jgi:hypothetical protein
LALETLRDLSAGLAGDRIPLALSAESALEILRDLSAGSAWDRIPLALSAESAGAAMVVDCCDSRSVSCRRVTARRQVAWIITGKEWRPAVPVYR